MIPLLPHTTTPDLPAVVKASAATVQALLDFRNLLDGLHDELMRALRDADATDFRKPLIAECLAQVRAFGERQPNASDLALLHDTLAALAHQAHPHLQLPQPR